MTCTVVVTMQCASRATCRSTHNCFASHTHCLEPSVLADQAEVYATDSSALSTRKLPPRNGVRDGSNRNIRYKLLQTSATVPWNLGYYKTAKRNSLRPKTGSTTKFLFHRHIILSILVPYCTMLYFHVITTSTSTARCQRLFQAQGQS